MDAMPISTVFGILQQGIFQCTVCVHAQCSWQRKLGSFNLHKLEVVHLPHQTTFKGQERPSDISKIQEILLAHNWQPGTALARPIDHVQYVKFPLDLLKSLLKTALKQGFWVSLGKATSYDKSAIKKV